MGVYLTWSQAVAPGTMFSRLQVARLQPNAEAVIDLAVGAARPISSPRLTTATRSARPSFFRSRQNFSELGRSLSAQIDVTLDQLAVARHGRAVLAIQGRRAHQTSELVDGRGVLCVPLRGSKVLPKISVFFGAVPRMGCFFR